MNLRSETRDPRWWQKEDDSHEVVFANAAQIKEANDSRLNMLTILGDVLYNDQRPEGVDLEKARVDRERRARFNVIQNAVDAVCAKITKNRPRPWVITIDGEWSLQQKAEQLTKFLDGEFARIGLYEQGELAFRDAAIYGTGVLKFHDTSGKVEVERPWVGELFVDKREERADHVRTLYQVMAIDREVLMECYPDKVGDIKDADEFRPNPEEAGYELSDLVMVVEAWHLPSKLPPKGEYKDEDYTCDGKHVVCVSNATLYSEDWKRDKFPFVFIHWSKNPRGWWGVGLAERMAGVQSALNALSEDIEECFELAKPSIWVADQAKINRHEITDDNLLCYRYDGAGGPPVFFNPEGPSAQHLMREQTLIDRAYELNGISKLAAQSQKPAGLNSGKAIMVHQDVESERFMTQGKAYERMYVECAEHIVALIDCAVEDGEDIEVMVGEETLEVISYSDVRLEDGDYRIRCFPVSALSSSPQGKLQEVQELVQLGVIQDPEEIMDLLAWPDLDHYRKVRSAGRDLADKLIEECMHGKNVTANPYMPLQYTLKQASLHVDLAKKKGAPASVTNALTNLIGQVNGLIERATPPAPPMPAGPMPAAPPPGPMAGMPPMAVPA